MNKGTAILFLLVGAVGFWLNLRILQSDWLVWAAVILIVTAAGGMLGAISPVRKEMRLERLGENNYRALPRQNPSERFWNLAIPLIAATVGGWAIVTRSTIQDRSWSVNSETFASVVGITTILLAAHFVRFKGAVRRFRQARVILTTDRPRLDEAFQIRVELEANRRAEKFDCRARIQCLGQLLLHYGRFTHLDLRPHSEEIVPLGEGIELAPGQSFSASGEVILDSQKHPPTGPTRMTMYPCYHWEIQIETTGAIHWKAVFPLSVSEPAEPSERYTRIANERRAARLE